PLTLVGSAVQTSNIITGLPSTANLSVGSTIQGGGIPANTTVTAILSATSIQISANATATNPAVALVFSTGGGANNLFLATNGVVDMGTGGSSQVIGSLTMEVGVAGVVSPSGSAASINMNSSS